MCNKTSDALTRCTRYRQSPTDIRDGAPGGAPIPVCAVNVSITWGHRCVSSDLQHKVEINAVSKGFLRA
eukprot:2339235-Amphidinium_carterae.2